jgi:hypothetical protein
MFLTTARKCCRMDAAAVDAPVIHDLTHCLVLHRGLMCVRDKSKFLDSRGGVCAQAVSDKTGCPDCFPLRSTSACQIPSMHI